jgi:outer membrane protein OmpA-like peptidoglycan-associated protein
MSGRRGPAALAGVLAALLLTVVALQASSAAHLRVSSKPLQTWTFTVSVPTGPPANPTPAPGTGLTPDCGAPSAPHPQTAASVRFASGSAHLTRAARKALRKVAPKLWLAKQVTASAFTYSSGRYAKTSKVLSAKRARAVVRFLKRLGVKAKVVRVAHGAPNPHLPDPKKNRRTVVAFIPSA